jgi:hypothetical protein
MTQLSFLARPMIPDAGDNGVPKFFIMGAPTSARNPFDRAQSLADLIRACINRLQPGLYTLQC